MSTPLDPGPDLLVGAAGLLRGAEALVVAAGAGMGVDSGLPDFRGPEGFWRAYPPYRRLGLRFEELADPGHFDDDPTLAWGFYGHRLALYRATVPHAGYSVVRRWADRIPTRVFTSNVDGAFQAAGFDGHLVTECHGAIGALQCSRPCHDGTWPADDVVVTVDGTTMRAVGPLPACARCGAVARPNILMFGDGSWVPGVHAARMAEHRAWLRTRPAVAVVELGAGTAVPTVRRHAELASAASGALVRVNVREPEVRHGRGVGVPGGARATLQALDALLVDAWR